MLGGTTLCAVLLSGCVLSSCAVHVPETTVTDKMKAADASESASGSASTTPSASQKKPAVKLTQTPVELQDAQAVVDAYVVATSMATGSARFHDMTDAMLEQLFASYMRTREAYVVAMDAAMDKDAGGNNGAHKDGEHTTTQADRNALRDPELLTDFVSDDDAALLDALYVLQGFDARFVIPNKDSAVRYALVYYALATSLMDAIEPDVAAPATTASGDTGSKTKQETTREMRDILSADDVEMDGERKAVVHVGDDGNTARLDYDKGVWKLVLTREGVDGMSQVSIPELDALVDTAQGATIDDKARVLTAMVRKHSA